LSRIDLEYTGREGIDTHAARARLALMQGDPDAADRWLESHLTPPIDLSLTPWMENPQLTQAYVLINRNQAEDIRAALHILDEVARMAESSSNIRVKIHVLALRALAQLSQGDSAGARASLIHSVELARRGPFTRAYVDLGSQMLKLLQQIAGHPSVAKSVGRILAAFPEAAAPAGPPAHASVALSPTLEEDELDESLTPREREVLVLMVEPISLKAIAARLHISYATARRYTINIYSKFGVHSRWEAVDCAIRKGIIPPA
jgi:ATP/maltotriose-dependent transcriptional regulator MalT